MASTQCERKFGWRSTTSDVLDGVNLSGRTIAITGATNGIGFETARSLAIAGAHLVMFCRNLAAAEAVKQTILGEKPCCQIDIVECDLAALNSVKSAAETFLAKGWPLHVLILNAGLVEATEKVQKDGLCNIVAINHLAGYYLTKLLMDKLIETNQVEKVPGRVVFLSSCLHSKPQFSNELTVEKLTKKLLFAPQSSTLSLMNVKYYGTSKLCNVWSAAHFQRIHGDRNVNFYSLHPGDYIYTNISKSFFVRLVFLYHYFGSKSVAQGAATTVFCASAEALNDGFGKGNYFVDSWPADESDMAKRVEMQEKMAQLSDDTIQDVIDGN